MGQRNGGYAFLVDRLPVEKNLMFFYEPGTARLPNLPKSC